MKTVALAIVALTLTAPTAARSDALDVPGAEPQDIHQSTPGGVPLARLLDLVAHKTGKKFVVDPRVHADVVILGEEMSHVSYPELLTILDVYGYSTAESGGFTLIVPASAIRVMPLPQLKGRETYPDSQYVTAVIPIANLPAGTLVPSLRPLIPSNGHLSAVACNNTLILIDSYANVRRLQELIKLIDVGRAYTPAKCDLAANP
jgi:type II secretory pathway component GspD/PulD (secretin)